MRHTHCTQCAAVGSISYSRWALIWFSAPLADDERFTVDQATGYLYADGLNAAARDPLQHVLPLIATHPETARGVIRTTLKQMVRPSSWPAGYQRDLLPYSLMSHGLVWPNRERGPSDLDLYALLTASEYVLETKDTAFLSETLRTYTLFGGAGEFRRGGITDKCLRAGFTPQSNEGNGGAPFAVTMAMNRVLGATSTRGTQNITGLGRVGGREIGLRGRFGGLVLEESHGCLGLVIQSQQTVGLAS